MLENEECAKIVLATAAGIAGVFAIVISLFASLLIQR
jgi:hypothetical protein